MGGKSRAILGVSADYHDAAAALVVDGELVAAAAQERFSRIKHDPSFPVDAIQWCLRSSGVGSGELSAAAFYEKPYTKLERVLATHARVGPRSVATLRKSIGSFVSRKVWVGARLEEALAEIGVPAPELFYAEHHQSHASAAFYASPFDRAAVVTCDGVGEATTASISVGVGNQLTVLREQPYPSSIGLFYAAITEFCGFAVNDGEAKLMGLAPYGEPRYSDSLRNNVIEVAEDGSVHLTPRWFAFERGERMTSDALAELLDGPRRAPDEPLGQREADIAASAQLLLEEALLLTARHARELTGEAKLCMAGGVALNCVANSRIRDGDLFDDVWVQPAAGDDGGAVGAAWWVWHQVLGEPRVATGTDGMSGASLGPSYSPREIVEWLTSLDVEFVCHESRADLYREVAEELAVGRTVGWFQGPMEFGPRALGHRSILADPRDPGMIKRLNSSVKRRESFRPFAPAVLAEEASSWFELDRPHPYMLHTAALDKSHRRSVGEVGSGLADRLAADRSSVPACTHVDHTARVQTVESHLHPELYGLLREFYSLTGCPMLVNTSFNRRDEPIVCTPADALRCFSDTDLDLLVLEDCLIRRPGLVRLEGGQAA